MSNFYERLKNDAHRQYIHLKKEHIGALYGYGSWGNLSSILSESRNRGRVLNDYRNFFASSLSKDSKDMFRNLSNMDKDKFIADANAAMKEVLEERIHINMYEELYNIKKNMVSATSIAQKLQNGKDALLECDSLLIPISEAIRLIESPEIGGNALLADLLAKNTEGKKIKASNMGIKIEKALDAYLKSNNYKGLSGAKLQAMNESVRALNNLAQNLKTKQKKGAKEGEYLNKNGWTTIFSNLFSLTFAEALGAVLFEHAFAAAEGTIIDMVGAKGAKTTTMTYNETGVIKQNQTKTKKTDIKGKHIQFSFQENTSLGNKSIFNINLGISMKFYESLGLPSLESKGLTGTFSSGSGGTLGAALVDVYGTNPKKLYFAKNLLAHDAKGTNLEESLMAIQNSILHREILRLFSTMGNKKDFSHFILVNGTFISTWDLLNYVLNNFVGKSSSQGAFAKKSQQGIALSIPGRAKIYEANNVDVKEANYEEALQRSHTVNEVINNTTIEARIHIKKLVDALKNSK